MYLFVAFALYLPALAVLGRILAEKRLIETQLGISTCAEEGIPSVFHSIGCTLFTTRLVGA